MANKSPKSGGSGGVLSVLALIGTAASLATPVIDYIADKLKEHIEEIKDWITIPELCSKKMPLKLDTAVDILEKIGLKVSHSPVELQNVQVKYKDCFPSQVVYSDSISKKLVPPGSIVVIKYVTAEVIEEAKRLFDESEIRKTQKDLEKAEKRLRQKEKNKQTINGLLSTVQQKTVDASAKAKQLKAAHNIKPSSEENYDEPSQIT